MSYRLRLTERAAKDFDRLPNSMKEQVDRRFDVLVENPRPPKSKALTEKELRGSYRVHVGPDYCIAYDIDDAAQVVDVWLIGHRKSFYEVAKRRRR